jgi:hypothetical protein
VSGLQLEGAQVWGLDSFGADVAAPANFTDETGHYSLVVPQGWDPDGDGPWRWRDALRVAAEHYWPFLETDASEPSPCPDARAGGTAVAMATSSWSRGHHRGW